MSTCLWLSHRGTFSCSSVHWVIVLVHTLYTVQTWYRNSHHHVHAHPRRLAHWSSTTTIVDKHISKQHIRWHTNHSAHVTRWRHTHRNTNRNWPAQHMSACRWAFRLRSVQYSGHILLVTYSFWLPERSSIPFVFLSCLRVWRFTPLVQTHSGRNQKSLKSTLEEKRHRNFHLLLFCKSSHCSTSSFICLHVCCHIKAQLNHAAWLTRACQTQELLLHY